MLIFYDSRLKRIPAERLHPTTSCVLYLQDDRDRIRGAHRDPTLSDPVEDGRMATIAGPPCDEAAIRSNHHSLFASASAQRIFDREGRHHWYRWGWPHGIAICQQVGLRSPRIHYVRSVTGLTRVQKDNRAGGTLLGIYRQFNGLHLLGLRKPHSKRWSGIEPFGHYHRIKDDPIAFNFQGYYAEGADKGTVQL
jgi:hypothetical protein